MFFDIHTHNSTELDHTAVQNLSFEAAEIIFSSNKQGLFSVGFHPWYISEFSDESYDKLKKWASDNRLIAIGECGLDKNSDASIEYQLMVFEKQIELSEAVQKPLIIHCVGCFNELLNLKRRLKMSQLWIIHGFRGKPQLAKQILEAGCALSFGQYFNTESVQLIPTEQLYVETDESDMSIEEIYATIAQAKGCNPGELNAGEKFYQQFLNDK
jgi:TatD DNase family protein